MTSDHIEPHKLLTDQEIADLGPGEVCTWAYEDIIYFARQIEAEILKRAQSSSQWAGVTELEKLRNAVEDATYEWAQYVEVDRAPETLQKYILDAFDAAATAQNPNGGNNG
ncbi:hypothetical protein 8G_00045 [Ralstonia phage Hyacinthe]|uniref:Uncharacterized protein n=3 Tax=Rahariannevirus raharianne TaxID=2846050 RepID=A0A7G5BBG0_9CAUD|nr:hypothetical protein KMC43_gp64 [Ralstonia phage Raharianne]QMV32439.1 hypothetical protein U2_00064 [Ralstonia phage Albius]QMV33477.1 hypothetical protein 8G_00045 [Ralstonia phage Hyacinthe]QMV33633.1 hypothetical protein Y2_00064 [Ralstonia phage Raharianne]